MVGRSLAFQASLIRVRQGYIVRPSLKQANKQTHTHWPLGHGGIHILVIPVLRSLGWECQEFRATLDYMTKAYLKKKKKKKKPDVVAHIFNSSLLKAEEDFCECRGSLVHVWSFRVVEGYIASPCLKT